MEFQFPSIAVLVLFPCAVLYHVTDWKKVSVIKEMYLQEWFKQMEGKYIDLFGK